MTPASQQQVPVRNEDDNPDRPAIHVSLAREVDEYLYRWVAVGAEEEGIPCRLVSAEEAGADAVALARTSAQSSRLGVGVGVVESQVAIHERHMPAVQPVATNKVEEERAKYACRLAGSNAARLVIGEPLRLD